MPGHTAHPTHNPCQEPPKNTTPALNHLLQSLSAELSKVTGLQTDNIVCLLAAVKVHLRMHRTLTAQAQSHPLPHHSVVVCSRLAHQSTLWRSHPRRLPSPQLLTDRERMRRLLAMLQRGGCSCLGSSLLWALLFTTSRRCADMLLLCDGIMPWKDSAPRPHALPTPPCGPPPPLLHSAISKCRGPCMDHEAIQNGVFLHANCWGILCMQGVAVFLASMKSARVGASLAFAIALHNIPEGVAVSLPVYFATGSRLKGFLYAFVSGGAMHQKVC